VPIKELKKPFSKQNRKKINKQKREDNAQKALPYKGSKA
jgi:hypothetical protein